MNTRGEKQLELINCIIDNKFSGVFIASPRFGKSYCVLEALKTLSYLNLRYLIIVPFKPVLKSWMEELVKWKFTGNIHFVIRTSLKSMDLTQFDIIIKDECHLLADSEIKLLKQAKKPIVAITGSLGKQAENKLLYNLGLRVKCNYSVEDAIEDGVISNYVVNLHSCNLTISERIEYNRLTQKHEYFKSVGNFNVQMKYAGERARLIYSSVDKISKAKALITSKKRVLVFTALTDVANELTRKTYHSKTKDKDNLEKFKKGSINKLTAIGQIDMGEHFYAQTNLTR
jgi:superfamily II DNA or RNA helicase